MNLSIYTLDSVTRLIPVNEALSSTGDGTNLLALIALGAISGLFLYISYHGKKKE